MNHVSDTNASAFDLDQQWIAEHYDELAGRHAEEWVAVKGRQVIAHDTDLARLLSRVPDLEHTCIEFIERRAPRFAENRTPATDAPAGR